MNYDNVKNPFDMYDESEDNEIIYDDDEFEEQEPNSDEEQEKQKSGMFMNILMICSYILILILAFFGIMALCNSEVRNIMINSFGFMKL